MPRCWVACLLLAGYSAGCSPHGDASTTTEPTTTRPCTPVTRSLDDAFSREHDPSSEEIRTAREIADRWIAVHPAETLEWGWGEGTVIGALVDLGRVTIDARYIDYVRRYVDRHIDEGIYVTTSDRCPPSLGAIELWQTTCDARYAAVQDTVLTYLRSEALRTDDGGISHLGTSPIFGATLWVDSLYMFGTPLVRMGEIGFDDRALDEYGEQRAIFARHLQDPSGFFVHAYHWPDPQDPNVFWARGNGWVLASGYDYLRVLAARGKSDDAARASLEALARAVVGAQDPQTGLYWTVVNRPGETYLETSATALFALGLARGIRSGVLDAGVRPTIRAAMDGVRSQIQRDAEGRAVVTGISGPTNVSTFAGYAAVKREDDLSYGVGAVILALIESSGLR